MARQLDVDGGSLGRMPDGVAKHVVAGAMQELEVAGHARRSRRSWAPAGSPAFRLRANNSRPRREAARPGRPLRDSRGRVALGAGELQQLVDQVRQAVGLLADAGHAVSRSGLVLASSTAKPSRASGDRSS